ncbi:DUF6192 family protein [Streptomyces sp. NPDC058614]|uniref:DUF6192 family protein n=1 Tax=Streptomyces sp. NPDC058614 TaxID=3346557 RepID=UPI003657A77C
MPTDTIGHITRERYEQIIAADRELVGQMQRIQFTIGDHALEIEPMQPVGGAHPAPGEEPFGVDVSLQIYADDLGLSLSTVRSYRFAAHRWPEGQRRHDVSHKVHYILAGIPDDQARFETIDAPPLDERARVRRWTTGLAKKHVGQLPDCPETPAQKVAAIHRLADDYEVAAQVATDVLRRPAVAAKVVADDFPNYGGLSRVLLAVRPWDYEETVISNSSVPQSSTDPCAKAVTHPLYFPGCCGVSMSTSKSSNLTGSRLETLTPVAVTYFDPPFPRRTFASTRSSAEPKRITLTSTSAGKFT